MFRQEAKAFPVICTKYLQPNLLSVRLSCHHHTRFQTVSSVLSWKYWLCYFLASETVNPPKPITGGFDSSTQKSRRGKMEQNGTSVPKLSLRPQNSLLFRSHVSSALPSVGTAGAFWGAQKSAVRGKVWEACTDSCCFGRDVFSLLALMKKNHI